MEEMLRMGGRGRGDDGDGGDEKEMVGMGERGKGG